MSTYTTDKASPFTRAVISSMRKLYPEALADQSFDNTGLLLEAPFDPIRRQMNSVLLTIDLTKAVADEAIERKDCIVVSYHPIIFKGFKALTLADTQQQSLLRLALEGISVYSPHTAVDAAPGGLGDWLADIVTGTLPGPEPETHTARPEDDVTDAEGKDADRNPAIPEEQEGEQSAETEESPELKAKQRPGRPSMGQRQSTYSKPTYPKPSELEKTDLSPSTTGHSRSVIHAIKGVEGFGEAGMGRLVKFKEPQPLTHLIERIAHGVGSPKGFPVAIPQTQQVEDIQIRSVGICAGSGHSVLKDVDADLLFTGELSHHDALAATEKGKCVVTLFHSNTERGFLSSVLKDKLTAVLKDEWKRVKEEVRGEIDSNWDLANEWEDALKDGDVLVECSERDRDPFGIVILQSSPQVGKPLSDGS
ncbi:MAG: NGG1 interacting factor [Alectoria fallacina]|uniref:NGG1 interacting factor n=1 Tax=Alectoria fallacina TaxID=1903189 RepID=A0A8H3J1B5_9LECA|nr:MAG: NGG1 interacting factor [Alectoria fallacina]